MVSSIYTNTNVLLIAQTLNVKLVLGGANTLASKMIYDHNQAKDGH